MKTVMQNVRLGLGATFAWVDWSQPPFRFPETRHKCAAETLN